MAAGMPDDNQMVEGGNVSDDQGGPTTETAQLTQNVAQGLVTIFELAQKTGAPESALQKMQQSAALFQSAMEELGGGGSAPQGGAEPVDQAEGSPMTPAGV